MHICLLWVCRRRDHAKEFQSCNSQPVDIKPPLILLTEMIESHEALRPHQVHDPRACRPVPAVSAYVFCLPTTILSDPALGVDGQAEVDEPEGRTLTKFLRASGLVFAIDENVVRVHVPVPGDRRQQLKCGPDVADQLGCQSATSSDTVRLSTALWRRVPYEDVQRLAWNNGHGRTNLPAALAGIHLVPDASRHTEWRRVRERRCRSLEREEHLHLENGLLQLHLTAAFDLLEGGLSQS
mmetsp:Transcript_20410/g.44496  ORF Transcript_20410/g.44496 Transcript_20410/m.44496 type:complete len:239 (+) Transcript_20410:1383-2099(+)